MHNYTEYHFSNYLDKFISCVWTEDYFNNPINQQQFQLIVPDKTIELIFTDEIIQRESKYGFSSQKSQLCGLKTVPQYICMKKSPLLAVRFDAKSFHHFTKVPIESIVNKVVDPIEIFGADFEDLENRLFCSNEMEGRINILMDFFNKQYLNNYLEDKTFYRAIDILNSKMDIRIKELASDLNVSSKTLQRKFQCKLGVNPKMYFRLNRFFNTIHTNNIHSDIVGIAIDGGYFDQMHFSNEVKEFTGLTPLKYLQQNRGVQIPIFKN